MKKREIDDAMVRRAERAYEEALLSPHEAGWGVSKFMRRILDAALNPDRRKGERRVSVAKPLFYWCNEPIHKFEGVEGRAPSGAEEKPFAARCTAPGFRWHRRSETSAVYPNTFHRRETDPSSGISRPSPTDEIPVSEGMLTAAIHADRKTGDYVEIYRAMEARRRVEAGK